MLCILDCYNIKMLSRVIVFVIINQTWRGVCKVLQYYVVNFAHAGTWKLNIFQTFYLESVVFRTHRSERWQLLGLTYRFLFYCWLNLYWLTVPVQIKRCLIVLSMWLQRRIKPLLIGLRRFHHSRECVCLSDTHNWGGRVALLLDYLELFRR